MSYNDQDVMSVANGKRVMQVLEARKANADGAYEDLTAGNALYLLSDRGDTDVAPYVFRKTGGAKNGYGREFLRKIVGGTVAWNQLIQNGNFADTTGWTTARGTISVSNNVCTYTVSEPSSTITGNRIVNTLPQGTTANHVLLAFAEIKASKTVIPAFEFNSSPSIYRGLSALTANVNTKIMAFVKSTAPILQVYVGISDAASYGYEAGDTIEFRNIQFFDLTQMFGSTIADAIYAMEQATAGSGVAWFRSLFPNSYYAYDAGSLQSVQAKEHKTVCGNSFDINNYIPTISQNGIEYIVNSNGMIFANGTAASRSQIFFNVPGNIVKQWKGKKISINQNIPGVSFFLELGASPWTQYADLSHPIVGEMNSVDDLKNTDTVTVTIRVTQGTTLNNVVFIPQVADSYHTYPLDSTLTLRGIPKWDSTNGLYYDGDEYTPDGSVKRKYGIVDLGTLTWTKYDVTQGTLFRGEISDIKQVLGTGWIPNCVCPLYPAIATSNRYDKSISQAINNSSIDILDNSYSDATTFKTAMSGVYLVYELATPTTETADAFRELEICNGNGTEEFVDAGVTASTPTRDVSVPVGTETFYPVDIWHLIDELTALVLEN